VESEGIKDAIFRQIFARFPKSQNEAWAFHRANGSLPRREKFTWLAKREIPNWPDQQLACVKECLLEFGQLCREKVSQAPEVKGANQLLKGLAGKIPIYVTSVNPAEDLEFYLKARSWDPYLTGWYGDPPVRKVDALLQMTQKEGCFPREVLLVGDSEGDQVAAREAGTEIMLRKMNGKSKGWIDCLDLMERPPFIDLLKKDL
jgi:phosphoglycolate phosphatase-like HAD superfamily hydrolase